MENKHHLHDIPASDRWMFLKAYFTIIGIKILLKFIPYNRLRQSIASQMKSSQPVKNDHQKAYRIAEAVKTACRYTPGNTTCLVKALAGYYLLTKNNIPVEMYIGVKLGMPGQLNAHAWLMNQGEVILGYIEDLPTYTKLNSQSMNAV